VNLPPTLADEVRVLVAQRLGLEFSGADRPDLDERLQGAVRGATDAEPDGFVARLRALPSDSPEWRHLASRLTIGETYFFRDEAAFAALEQQILPALIARRRDEGVRRLRLWSAGCATGEEPYSLAILLDRLLPDRAQWALTIRATDLNCEALDAARRGRYRAWALRATPDWVRARYFRRLTGGGGYEIDPALRALVDFVPLNLAEETYPSVVTNTAAMDLILCRNVLMYFARRSHRAVAVRLAHALVPGGWLLVSPAETSVDLFQPLRAVNLPGAIFYQKDAALLPRIQLSATETVCPTPPSSAPVEPPPPREPAHDLTLARALADRGDLEQARRCCETSLGDQRLNPEAHLLLAAICQEQGDLAAALEALRRALYLAPDSAAGHFLLGGVLLRRGQRHRARRCLQTVVDLLRTVPHDALVPGADGLTASRLAGAARAYLEAE
jgi:chemotaxis protein methyltransferase CheR